MGIFRRKKKEPEQRVQISGGLFLEYPRNGEKQNALLSCVPKGLFSFLVVFGSLGGFLSAFEMECNYVIPAVVLFLSAMYFSGLFGFRKGYWKDLGYIIYFMFYVAAVYLLQSYVNSGFAAIVNIVRQRGELYFNLAAGTEFAEKIEDRYLTITITVIFFGIFEIILLNIFLSNYMSLKLALFVGLALYVFPLYLQREPDLFFALCMVGGFAGIYVYKNSGHFKDGPVRRRDYERVEKGKNIRLSYTQNNKGYRGVLFWTLAFVLILGVCTLFYGEDDFRRSYVENPYKTATREGVSGFIMIGFRSFFPNLYSRGGMSGGKFGNISAIRPDNETDLIVRFAPYSSSPVYLKGYTGLIYENNGWMNAYELRGSTGNQSFFGEENMEDEAYALSECYEAGREGQAKAVMEIVNKGADVRYVYLPYFTRLDDYGKYEKAGEPLFVGSSLGKEQRFTFYPNIGYKAELKDSLLFKKGEEKSKAYSPYSIFSYRIPEVNRAAVDRFIAASGIKAGDPDVVDQVVSHLKEDYSYSYNPGRLPQGTDMVNYFLDENKKGVCYHFATAAVLIFRRLGIPARYAEGYAFGYSTVLEGNIREDLNYDDYYSGYSQLGRTAVMEVDVTDANAHAWVEIYDALRGWIVVDPTPAVTEDEQTGGDFWSSLTNFLQNSPDVQFEGDLSEINLSFLRSDAVRISVISILALAAFICFIILAVRRVTRWRSWHTTDLSRNMLWYYREVCRRRGRRDPAFGKLSMPSEQLAYLFEARRRKKEGKRGVRETEPVDEERVLRCLEEICFCPAQPAKEDYDYVMGVLRGFY